MGIAKEWTKEEIIDLIAANSANDDRVEEIADDVFDNKIDEAVSSWMDDNLQEKIQYELENNIKIVDCLTDDEIEELNDKLGDLTAKALEDEHSDLRKLLRNVIRQELTAIVQEVSEVQTTVSQSDLQPASN